MSADYVSKKLRQKIARRAKERCGGCLVSALITGVDLQVEHLWPTSKGGLTVEDNLWLACAECNLAGIAFWAAAPMARWRFYRRRFGFRRLRRELGLWPAHTQ